MDVFGARLLRYSGQGSYLGAVTHPGLGELEFNHPTELVQAASGFVLENPPGKLLWLDRSYKPVRSADFLKAESSKAIPGKIISYGLLDFVLSGGDLVGVVIVHVDERPWLGFARLEIQPFRLSQLLEEVKIGSAEHRMSSLVPITLAHGGGPAAGPILFKVLERSSIAAGLYGRGDFLYLLTRKPAVGGTLWQLWQIDPRRDSLIRSLTLPTMASEIYLSPGSQQWAVIEKGPVTQPGQQAIKSMLLIPSPWIEDPASKALADGQTVTCR